MIDKLESEVARVGVRLLDDAHAVWFAAANESAEALRAWLDASPRTQNAAYFTYLAALDREQAAAGDLERLSKLTAPCEQLVLETGE
jgi:hypothetical protein